MAELGQSLSSAELAEWMAYHRLSPIDDARGDLQAAIVASIVANAHRAAKTAPFSPVDFMPYLERAPADAAPAFVAAARQRLNLVTFIRHGRAA